MVSQIFPQDYGRSNVNPELIAQQPVPFAQPRLVIGTKLQIPQRRHSKYEVERHDLLELLDAYSSRRLTLVVAPAGYGKTSLVAEWSRRTARKVAWLTLDTRDNDRVRFLLYLRAALRGLSDETARAESDGFSAPDLELDNLVTLTGSLHEPATLVLDDLQLINDEWIFEAIEYLISFASAQLHFILATRSKPQAAWSRLKFEHEYAEIGLAELELTPSQIGELLAASSEGADAESRIAAIMDATRGWISAAKMMAMVMEDGVIAEDPRAWINQSSVGEMLSDYLIEEVLGSLKPARLDFLLRIAICDRISGPLSERLTGIPDGRHELLAIERAGLFLSPLGQDHKWFQLHPLFRRILLEEAERQLPASERRELHLRASIWFEETGYLEDAVHHAIAIEDWERTTALLSAALPALDLQRRYEYIRTVLQQVPQAVLDASGRISVYQTLAVSASRAPQEADALVRRYRSRWAEDPDPGVRGYGAILESRLALDQGDWRAAIEHAQRAIEAAGADDPLATMRARYHVSRAMWMAGKPHRTLAFVEEMLRDFESYDREIAPYGALQFKLAIARLHIEMGKVDDGETELEDLYREFGQLHPRATVVAPLWLAGVAYGRNDLQGCHDWLLRVSQTEFTGDLARFEPRWHLLRARLLKATGKTLDAREAFKEAIAIAELRNDVRWQREIRAAYAIFGLDIHDRQIIEEWVRSTPRPSALSSDVVDVKESLAFARVFLGLNRPLDAIDILSPVTSVAQADSRVWDEVDGHILSAFAYGRAGDLTTSRKHLSNAISLARQGGFVRPFMDAGTGIYEFVVAEMTRREAPASPDPFINSVIRSEVHHDDSLGSFAQPLEELTTREVQILRLISLGLSNQVIADRAGIAVSTVKRHVSNILTKLQARSRTEALHIARQSGLIEK